MRTIDRVAQLQAELAPWRQGGRRIVLVPTMGNLHAGHLSLVRKAREHGDCVVVSVFVNPLQFGPKEDFARYPRTLDADRELLAAEGVDVLFAPEVADVYPGGYPPATTVQIGGPVAETLDGEFRPGHFTGVATVVHILFGLVAPQVAVFGEKDWQQLQVIRRMTADLALGVDIVGAATVRDGDGLALSSRNQYLSAGERGRAAALHASLQAAAQALRAGRRDFDAIAAEQSEHLQTLGFTPQYFAVREPGLTMPGPQAARFVVLVAAYLGTTRLIDNVKVQLD